MMNGVYIDDDELTDEQKIMAAANITETGGVQISTEKPPAVKPKEAPVVDNKKTKIFLYERGECSFVTKVRNAERLGASLVVVIDNKQEMLEKAVMGDDGTGAGIRVPSMMIGLEDGQKLIEFAKKDATATLSAEFTPPNI
jgi:hypothetical protein